MEDLQAKVLEKVVENLENEVIQRMEKQLSFSTKIEDVHIGVSGLKIPKSCYSIMEKKGFSIKEPIITVDTENKESRVYKHINEKLKKRRDKIIQISEIAIKEIKFELEENKEICFETNDSFKIQIRKNDSNRIFEGCGDEKIAVEFFRKYGLTLKDITENEIETSFIFLL